MSRVRFSTDDTMENATNFRVIVPSAKAVSHGAISASAGSNSGKWPMQVSSQVSEKQAGKPKISKTMTDPIADYLTRLRNAIQVNHKVVNIPASNLKKSITKILFEKGYILNYKFEEEGPQGNIKIALKYNRNTKASAIRSLKRASRPGLRKYSAASEMPRVLNGLGVAVVSTSQGLMTDKEARKLNVGGEVLCYVY